MTSIASSASEVRVQHRSLLIERGYEEFTGRLEQILGRFVASKLKGLTPDGAMEALKSMEGEQGFLIINIFDHGADLLMVGQPRRASTAPAVISFRPMESPIASSRRPQ